MPATDPPPALLTADQALEQAGFTSAADQALAQAKAFAESAVRAWHSEDDAATVAAAAQISIAYGQIANLEQLRAWEAE